MTQTTQKEKTLLSPRIPRDTEHERYHPELEEELKECLFCLHRNEMMFDLEAVSYTHLDVYKRQARAKAVLREADFPYVSCNWVDLRTGLNVLPSVKRCV